MLTFLRGTFGPENSDTENSYAILPYCISATFFFFFLLKGLRDTL